MSSNRDFDHHSIALVKFLNDSQWNTDDGKISVLVLLDLISYCDYIYL